MRCSSCEKPISVAGAFPGASLRCACGAANVVPRAAPSVVAPPPAKTQPSSTGANDSACPRCARPLRAGEGGVGHACTGCRGEFVDHVTLAMLVRREDAKRAAAPMSSWKQRDPVLESEIRYVKCPRCHEMMSRSTFGQRSGIVVDTCPKHGTWFDVGELEGALGFIRSGGLAGRPAARVAARSEDQGEARALGAHLEVSLMTEQRREKDLIDAVTNAGQGVRRARRDLDLLDFLFDVVK